MTKKDAAQVLYLQDYTLQEIADILGYNIMTVQKWSQKGNWKEKRVNQNMLHDNSVATIMELIDYQVQALKRKKDEWLEEDNRSTRLIERGDLDGLQKLFTTIKKDTKKFGDYVYVMKDFHQYLQVENLKLAKEFSIVADKFINLKREAF